MVRLDHAFDPSGARCRPVCPMRGPCPERGPWPATPARSLGPVPDIDLVLFDLGGVLIELGGMSAMRDLAGLDDDDEVWRRWLACPWVRTFERGGCSPEEFAAGLVEDWGLSVTPQAFLTSFAAWPRGPYPGAPELVAEVQQIAAVGCLSNTNALHWERHGAMVELVGRFEHRFLSFELGLLKPDRELFERIAELVPVRAERVLFLDDNQVNVDGAAAVGFHAERARGVDEARAALVAGGVLAAPAA
jgi:HAD superfamily hydrolase (TIGR01509 family)